MYSVIPDLFRDRLLQNAPGSKPGVFLPKQIKFS